MRVASVKNNIAHILGETPAKLFTLNTKNFLCLKWGRKFAGPAEGSSRGSWSPATLGSPSSCGRSTGAAFPGSSGAGLASSSGAGSPGSAGAGFSGSAGEELSGCGCSSFAASFCGSSILEVHDTFSTTTTKTFFKPSTRRMFVRPSVRRTLNSSASKQRRRFYHR